MPTRVFIDGAAGTTGLEIRERLTDREAFEISVLSEAQRKNVDARRDALNAADIAILCLPDEAARDAVAMIDNETTRVIDASSAHRVADGWTYGFPELIGRENIAQANRVSNPGCYPTGFLALIAPLTTTGLLRRDYPFSVNAVSGYSGGGKPLIKRFTDESEIAWRGYGYALDHKHLPEMQRHAQLTQAPIFAPSVVSAFRGMIVEVPLSDQALDRARSMDELRDTLIEFYKGSALVSVEEKSAIPGEIVLQDEAAPSDRITLWVLASSDGSRARLVARLDNLGKGASGAAIQSLNLMTGQPETAGLMT